MTDTTISKVILVASSVLVTLVCLAPIAYVAKRSLPPPIVTIDLQQLLENHSNALTQSIPSSGEIPEAKRKELERSAAEFAQRLSAAAQQLGETCGCVIVNKAALLGGDALDYTDVIAEELRGVRSAGAR